MASSAGGSIRKIALVGLLVAAAILVIEMEEVLLAKIAFAGAF